MSEAYISKAAAPSTTPEIRPVWWMVRQASMMASEGYVKKHGMKPRARIVATANMGDDPTLMLNAPVPAARKVLAKAGLTTDD